MGLSQGLPNHLSRILNAEDSSKSAGRRKSRDSILLRGLNEQEGARKREAMPVTLGNIEKPPVSKAEGNGQAGFCFPSQRCDNRHDQNSFKKQRFYLSLHFQVTGQEREAEAMEDEACWLTHSSRLAGFLIQPRAVCLGIALPTVGGTLLCQ